MRRTVFLEVELVINTQSGLKIPVSSIVEKEFYTVPREFMTLGDNGSSPRIYPGNQLPEMPALQNL